MDITISGVGWWTGQDVIMKVVETWGEVKKISKDDKRKLRAKLLYRRGGWGVREIIATAVLQQPLQNRRRTRARRPTAGCSSGRGQPARSATAAPARCKLGSASARPPVDDGAINSNASTP